MGIADDERSSLKEISAKVRKNVTMATSRVNDARGAVDNPFSTERELLVSLLTDWDTGDITCIKI